MKHEFHCTWGQVDLYVEDSGWNVQYSGDIPVNIKKSIVSLKKSHPRPDSVMAHFMIKTACTNTLLYIK